MPRKEAGFRQLGDLDCMDKTAERKFAGLTREQKREFQKAWRRESGDIIRNRQFWVISCLASIPTLCLTTNYGLRLGYNDRWSVEIVFSTFKRVLGECISARKWENVKAEIYGKVQLYNQMIDTAIDNGYGTPRIVQAYKPGPKDCKGRGQDDDVGRIAQTSICVERN